MARSPGSEKAKKMHWKSDQFAAKLRKGESNNAAKKHPQSDCPTPKKRLPDSKKRLPDSKKWALKSKGQSAEALTMHKLSNTAPPRGPHKPQQTTRTTSLFMSRNSTHTPPCPFTHPCPLHASSNLSSAGEASNITKHSAILGNFRTPNSEIYLNLIYLSKSVKRPCGPNFVSMH